MKKYVSSSLCHCLKLIFKYALTTISTSSSWKFCSQHQGILHKTSVSLCLDCCVVNIMYIRLDKERKSLGCVPLCISSLWIVSVSHM